MLNRLTPTNASWNGHNSSDWKTDLLNVNGFDERIGLCIDVGHTARAKVNPAEAIIKCKDRLYDLHIKDINSTEPNGTTIEGGRGVLDLAAILHSLQKIKYSHLVSIEYEGWENDPLPAVQPCQNQPGHHPIC